MKNESEHILGENKCKWNKLPNSKRQIFVNENSFVVYLQFKENRMYKT